MPFHLHSASEQLNPITVESESYSTEHNYHPPVVFQTIKYILIANKQSEGVM